MRHSIEIDAALMKRALESTGFDSKRAVVEEGLRLLISVKGQEGVRRLRGKITFEGYASGAEIREKRQ